MANQVDQSLLKIAIYRVQAFMQPAPGLLWKQKIYEPLEDDPSAQYKRNIIDLAMQIIASTESTISAEEANAFRSALLAHREAAEADSFGVESADYVAFIEAIEILIDHASAL
jgi:hypothetical protein